MNIIRPAHNQVAKKVKSWSQIKEQATELRQFIGMTEGIVEGYYKTAYAISHAQVSPEPFDFFVVNEEKNDLIKLFGSWCIINPRIIKQEEEVYWKEACMSFPYYKERNVDRFNKITITYKIPFFKYFMRSVTKHFIGLPAFICQHEQEHANGTNIYGRTKQK